MKTVFALICLISAVHYATADCSALKTFSTELQPACAGNDMYVKWPNYANQSNYYKCVSAGTPVLTPCPSGQYFIYVQQVCGSCAAYIPPVTCANLKTQNKPICVAIGSVTQPPAGNGTVTTGPVTTTTTGYPTPNYPDTTAKTTTTKTIPTRTTKTTISDVPSPPTPPTPPTSETPSPGPTPPTISPPVNPGTGTTTTEFPGPPSPVTSDPNVPTPPTPPPTPPTVENEPPVQPSINLQSRMYKL